MNILQDFLTLRHGVVTLYGYGITVRVEHGHLVLEDGIGTRRKTRFPRVRHGIRRLVVIGSDGMVSLAALRWLADQDASFVMLERDGSVLAGGRLLLAMIERCVRDAGGTYLCCDTDALIIVASETGGAVQMPDGAFPITALSWNEVEQIRHRFDSLSPYNRKIVPHLLRLTDENYDKNGAQRQLFGLSIAAKRYALYTTNCEQPYCNHRKCVTVVDPKAHGLIFFAPSEDREGGLPKWWWELWRFLLTLEFEQIKDGWGLGVGLLSLKSHSRGWVLRVGWSFLDQR